MAVFAVVPVKNLEASKRRLSTLFSPQERSLLTLAMLEDVLRALQASDLDEIVVIGSDCAIQRMADRFGVCYLEASQDGLNSALIEAAAWCMGEQADWVLVLPADIPLLRPVDVNQIIEMGVSASSVVLSPSHDGGTNALFQSTPTLVEPHFGPASFGAHIEQVHHKDSKVRFYGSLNILHDIDSAQDLKKVLEIENNTLCREALEQIISRNQAAHEYFNIIKQANPDRSGSKTQDVKKKK